MDFSLSAEQREIQALARDVAESEIVPHAAASSVARIAALFGLPASLHRTRPSRPDDEASF